MPSLATSYTLQYRNVGRGEHVLPPLGKFNLRSMKSLVIWWSSSRSLLHSIIKLTIPCLFIALFIVKFVPLDANLDGVKAPSHDAHVFLQRHISPPSSSLLKEKEGPATPKHKISAGKALGETKHPIPANPESSQTKDPPPDALLKPSTAEADIGLKLAALGLDQARPAQTPVLGIKITNWDQQRQAWLAQNAHGRLWRRPNILLVTGSSPRPCANPLGDHLLLQFTKNKIDYCRLHGIDIFYNTALLNADMDDCWSKLPLLRRLMLSHPEVEWIWWMDSDAAFTDMTFDLPMDRYAQHNLVLHGWDHEIYIKKSWVGLNAGVFLIRNCQWSLDFMNAWARLGESRKLRDRLGTFFSEFLTKRPVFVGDDQAALVYILHTQKDIWESKVYFENSYYLHGYWQSIVDKYEELMQTSHAGYGDERWPLVTHFVGCKPCGEQSLQKSRCLKQMERAINFADNQVLHHYGFRHAHLSTFEVLQIANETIQG